MKLFEKTRIGTMELKNRIMVTAVGTTTNTDGSFSEKQLRFIEERAKGGAGLISTGATQVSSALEGKIVNIIDGSGNQLAELAQLADRVHMYGAKLCLQLTAGLGRMLVAYMGRPVYSASENDCFWIPGMKTEPMSKEQIEALVNSTMMSAAFAKACGVDCIEFHGYGGYLIDQFISPLWNRRTDEYGGSLRARMKFPCDLIKAVKQGAGADFPVIFKFSPEHYIPGGTSMEEGREIARLLVEAGADALSVDTGCYETWYKSIDTIYEEKGYQASYAAEIKKIVDVPVIAQGKLHYADLAEQLLQDGGADIIGIGHQMIADPQWPAKVKAGKTDQIRSCIGCNECLFAFFNGKHLKCSVNPHAFSENEFAVTEAKDKKRVLVVGGGPGGMQAAITAAERGFAVDLWEKAPSLGGALSAAGGPSFKEGVKDYMDYLARTVNGMNISVSLSREATAEAILAGGYDKIILATGSSTYFPPIKGIDGKTVVNAMDVLNQKAGYGKNVVVIGGGLVGCETAVACAEQAEHVTIVEMLDDILATVNHCKNNDFSLRRLIADSGIAIVGGAKVTEITGDSVTYQKDGAETTVAADTVIIASGFKAENALAEELSGKVDTAVIGDAVRPDSIMAAVHGGFHTVRLM